MRLIDADALEALYEEGTDPDDCYADMAYIRAEHIFDAPTIEAEPVKHAEWISELVPWIDWRGNKRKRFQPISCSYCHTPSSDRTNYCSCCGAKMQTEPPESEVQDDDEH